MVFTTACCNAGSSLGAVCKQGDECSVLSRFCVPIAVASACQRLLLRSSLGAPGLALAEATYQVDAVAWCGASLTFSPECQPAEGRASGARLLVLVCYE